MNAEPLGNGWTGGQYSVFRVIFGAYLAVHFGQLIPWGREVFSNEGVLPDGADSPLLLLFPNVFAIADGPVFVVGVLIAAAVLSGALAIGWFDRVAAVVLFYLWACLFGRNPLISNPSIPFVGWLLLAHAFLPTAPYGSWSARGRVDPDGGWRLPQPIFRVAWIVMALGYSYSGLMKLGSPSWIDGSALYSVLQNPLARPSVVRDVMLAVPEGAWIPVTWAVLGLELLFAVLALSRKVRPWIWVTMLAMHVGLIVLIDFADLSLGMVMMSLFTFDPAWIRPASRAEEVTLFYDGDCGLCHRTVRFLLAEDPDGSACALAPLQGPRFASLVAALEESSGDDRIAIPDSIVVERADGSLLFHSSAVLFVMSRLGGIWRLASAVARVVPGPVRDLVYRCIARVRKRLFPAPKGWCPIIPERLRSRFDNAG